LALGLSLGASFVVLVSLTLAGLAITVF